MLIVPPAKYRKGSRPANRKKNTGPAALVLQAAELFADDQYIVLTFDRSVDIAEIDPGAITVFDGFFTLYQYTGTSGGATLLAPNIVKVLLSIYSAWSDGVVKMTATDATGIVAGDGGTWAGVTLLPLPYP